MARPGEHELQRLPEPRASQDAARLDEQDLPFAVRIGAMHVRAELVGEQPQRLGGQVRSLAATVAT
ncbi:MAG: hypothetical protein JNM77_16575 [Pseudonocardia sp.]|nr:hypothetical protein [Pseudonocardia sp.]